jgi:glyoxylase-like metal-dependent hydrolase (beta-lactamase superfamily II)
MKYTNSKNLFYYTLTFFLLFARYIFAQLPQSKHFKLEKLADGVYAAIATDSGYAVSNAGIVDLGEKTLIFDTFINPLAAEDLQKAADSLTHNPISYVVNSHYHDDHIQGNQVFPQNADIISTAWTRDEIQKEEPEQIKWDQENIPDEIKSMQQKLTEADDSLSKANVKRYINYLIAIKTALPILKVRLPNVTFDKELIIHGTKRDAQLITWGKGHTGSDCVLNLPQDDIVFAGDLLFVKTNPYLADGYPEDWKRNLRNIDRLNPQIIVPGHGPLGNDASLSVLTDYIQSLQNLVSQMIDKGKTLNDISDKQIPSPYNTWAYPSFFKSNVEFLYNLQKKGDNNR